MHRIALKTLIAVGVFVMAATVPPATAAVTEARLKQAAQHFSDIGDAEAKAILDELSAEGVTDANVLLGYLYSDPLYQGRDYGSAVAAFKRAAAGGSEEALFQIAESRFWPGYSDWELSLDERTARPTVKEAHDLLLSIAGHNAAKWRLAYLCTFGGYDCGEKATSEAIRAGSLIFGDNLRAITNAYGMMKFDKSGAAGPPENQKMLKIHLELGYAAADPFVAALQSDPAWADVSHREDCPDSDNIGAAARLLALTNGTATSFDGGLNLEDCYDEAELGEVERRLGILLDMLVRTHSYENSWSQRWCYRNHEWPAIGQCLITTVRDHFFACTKLSMPKYFNERFGIEYRDSRRYQRCREQMWGAREG